VLFELYSPLQGWKIGGNLICRTLIIK